MLSIFEFLESNGIDEYFFSDYDSACLDTAKLYEALQDRRYLTLPNHRTAADNWLRIVTYRTVENAYREDELRENIDMRIEVCGVRKRGVAGAPNQFQDTLLSIFAHKAGLLSSAKRWKIGQQLNYAHRHFVPAEFLLGFLHEIGMANAEDRAQTDTFEPKWKPWIESQLQHRSVFDAWSSEHPRRKIPYRNRIINYHKSKLLDDARAMYDAAHGKVVITDNVEWDEPSRQPSVLELELGELHRQANCSRNHQN